MAVAPLLIGDFADRAGLLSALHVALAAQILGAVFFVMAILVIKKDMGGTTTGEQEARMAEISRG